MVKPIEGSIILLVGVPPSEFLPENKEKKELEKRFLDGLGDLLRSKLRIRNHPKTGVPMVYAVPLAMVQKDSIESVGTQRDALWSVSDPLSVGGVSMSVNRLIIDQEGEGSDKAESANKLSVLLAQLTEMVEKSRRLQEQHLEFSQDVFQARRRREAPETRMGSRVFLEFEEEESPNPTWGNK